MASLARILRVLPLLVAMACAGPAFAQGATTASTERFAGETQLGSQPPIPAHVELARQGDTVTGTLSIPGSQFELEDARGAGTIVGRFRGAGGSGGITLRTDGDLLTAVFDLAGQSGTITAQRTTRDAETFFRPPAQRMDLTTAQWREDLDHLVAILTREHGSPFHRTPAEAFEREAERVRAAIPDLDAVAAALAFRRLGALIGDGHTSVDLPHGRPRLPIEFYWFEDGLRVVGLPARHRDLLGARLVAVDEVPVMGIAQRLRAYIPQGETEGFHRARTPGLLHDPDVLRAIGLGANPTFAFMLEIDGRQERVVLASHDGDEPLLLGRGRPLWQRHDGQAFHDMQLPDGSVYVNWRAYDGLADHGAALLRKLEANRPPRLIIDLRDNEGGDYTVGRNFIEAIRNTPWLDWRRRLYVLIGRKTFSAAMTNAVDFKRTTQAILVGEPAGAAPNNWQEVRQFHLPNSGLGVRVSTRYYAFLPGSPELLPDHHVPPEPDDWANEHDAAMRFVLAQPVD
ncbi:S41 family peptidase [Luteimonas saliphila]|uniref:S41 family peptidase n=1 Tax=Luteimonas saliphila TaxID=2804919 RepID=UPI00192D2F03|nr:S41 family peptidase [Luteimonas saliphila]